MKKLIILAAVMLLFTALTSIGCTNNGGITRYYETGKKDAQETTADNFTYEKLNGKITITGLQSEETEVVIPSYIEGLAVTEIKEYAFRGNKNLRSLTVPKTVEKIGYGILSECAGLSRITLPFTGERHMKKRSANDYNFGYIFGKAEYSGGERTMQFYHTDLSHDVELVYYSIPMALKEVYITGVEDTHIPYGAFYNCGVIEKITLGKNVTTIGEFAFSGVNAEIIFEEPQITVIGEHAFEDYKGLSLTIPDSVREIKKKGYSDCVNVKQFTIPDSVKDVDIYAFSFCYDLERVNFGKNVEKLSAETFYFCINLKSVCLPEKLRIIEDGAFDSCKALEEITIPKSVTRINANAFITCEKLKTVRFEDTAGWRYYSVMTSGDELPQAALSDPSTAAKYLTDTFRDYIWEKAPVQTAQALFTTLY